jgi:hypothetical protein
MKFHVPKRWFLQNETKQKDQKQTALGSKAVILAQKS